MKNRKFSTDNKNPVVPQRNQTLQGSGGQGGVSAHGTPSYAQLPPHLHRGQAVRMVEMHSFFLGLRNRGQGHGQCQAGTWATADDAEMFAFHLQIISFSQFIIRRLKGEECTPGPSIISTTHSWQRVDDRHTMSLHKSVWGVCVPEDSMDGSFECRVTKDWKQPANYEKCLLFSRKCKSKYKLRTICPLQIWQK